MTRSIIAVRAGADANCISACSDYCRVRFGSVRTLKAEELDQLVSPIALHPDALLAEIRAGR